MRWLTVLAIAVGLGCTEATINGWPVVAQANGVASVAVAPSIGGRVVSFRLDDHEFIFTDPALAGRHKPADDPDPQFWAGGGRTWLAPQERWTTDGAGWPPPPRLDYTPWQVRNEAGRIAAISPVESDPRWNCMGMRIERSVALTADSARVEVTHTLINDSDRHQAWAPWSNVQVKATPGAAWAWFPVRETGQYQPYGFMWYGSPKAAATQGRPHPGLGVAAVQYLHREGKLGADADRGWICSTEDGWAFARQWTIPAKARHTENGNTLAVYTCGTLHLMEVESMGPLAELPPGGRTTFAETWMAARIPVGPVLSVAPGGIVIRHLSIDRTGNASGAFGIPDRGIIRLRQGDRTLWQGASDPLRPFVLSAIITHEAASDVVCESVASDGTVRLISSWPAPSR
jgi:hypothetical protein